MVWCITASNIAWLDNILVLAQGRPLKLPIAFAIVRVKVDTYALKALIRVLFDLKAGWGCHVSGSSVSWTLRLILAYACRMAEYWPLLWLSTSHHGLRRTIVGIGAIILAAQAILSGLPPTFILNLSHIDLHTVLFWCSRKWLLLGKGRFLDQLDWNLANLVVSSNALVLF